MALKKFIIERDIPGVGALTEDQLLRCGRHIQRCSLQDRGC
jgi:hypothetical protein